MWADLARLVEHVDGEFGVARDRCLQSSSNGRRLDILMAVAADEFGEHPWNRDLDERHQMTNACKLTMRGKVTSSSSQVLVDDDGSINPDFGELDQVGVPRRYQLGFRFRF